jgi:uncharacterized protein (TIGR02145 family)
VNTGSVLEIVLGRARIGGTVVADNGAPVTARGVAYGTSPNPTIEAAAFTMAGAGVGAFESNVLGLSPATTYHARAYATNSSGSCYGESRQFSTPAPQACPANPTVTDASANVYDTVQIGLQCWMKQNLRTAKYRNQDPVGQVTAGSNIYANAPAAGTAAWVAVDDPNWNEQAFGKLYTHGAVADARGLCPAGWRVPTENDWNILVSYLDPAANLNAPVDFAGWQLLSSTAGGALKSTAMFPTPLFGWPMPNAGATDSSGFGGLPAGWAAHGGQYVGGGAGWWTADTAAGDKAWYRTAQRDSGAVQRRSDLRKYGQSVRCIKN